MKTGRPRKPATKAKTVQMSVRVEIGLKLQFEKFAESEHLEASDIIRKALREYASRQEKAA